MATAKLRELHVLRVHRLAPVGWWCLRRLVSPNQVRLVLILHATEATTIQLSTLDGCHTRHAAPTYTSLPGTAPRHPAWWSKDPFKARYRQPGPSPSWMASTSHDGELRR